MEGVFFFVPVVIFLTVVAPIWLVLHYRSKSRSNGAITADERQELEEMLQVAENMAARIETLESILDDQSPKWRDRA